MWCLTPEQGKEWCGRHFQFDDSGRPLISTEHFLKVPFSGMNWSRLLWFAEFLGSHVEPFDECLVWVTLTGVWASSENLHLFYRLRESYGERRRVEDAPGHLFLKHESADLATFLQLGLLNGWDFYLLTAEKYGTVFVSHDEYARLYANSAEAIGRTKATLEEARVPVVR